MVVKKMASTLSQSLILHGLNQHLTHLGRARAHMHTSGLQGGDFGASGTLATGNDSSSVAHTSAGRSGDTGDEGYDGLGVGAAVGLGQEFGSLLLGFTTDLTDHDDSLGGGIMHKDIKAVNEVSTVEWITTNTNTESLSKANQGSLMNSLVGQGTRAGNNTDNTLLVNMSGHNTDLALAGGDNTGAVGTDQARLALADQGVLHLDHVLLGNTFSDADDQGDFRLQGLKNGGGSTGRWDVDNGGVRFYCSVGLGYRVEDGQTKMFPTSLAWANTSDHVGTVLNGLSGVECALLTSETLANNFGVLG